MLGGLVGKLGPVGAAVGAVGLAFAAMGLKAIKLADELSDISDATGISAGSLNNFKNSLVDAGGKADDFSNLAAKLNQNVGEAAVGGEKAQKAFQQLGVYVTDAGGKVRNTGDILRDAIARLAAIEDPATRASMAVDLFGKSANKLDFTKLNAGNDFAKDEQIAQLAKYQTAIDNIAKSVNDSLITAFGKLSIAISKAVSEAEQAEKDANARGRTLGGTPAAAYLGIKPLINLNEREMTANEKAEKTARDHLANMREIEAENEAKRKQIAGSGASKPTGGFGATPEATLKAIADSEKRVAQSRIENNKFASLKVEEIKLAAALQGANARMAIDINAASSIKNIQIQTQADISKATADIQNQDKLSQEQKNKEIASKSAEIQGKAALDIQKIKDKAAADATSFQLAQNAKIFASTEDERQATRAAIIAQQDQFNAAAKTAQERSDAYQRATMELEDQIMLENDLKGLNELQAGMYRQIADEIKNRTNALRELANIENLSYEDRLKQEAKIKEASMAAIELIKQRAEAEQYGQSQFSTGWEESWQKYKETVANNSNLAKGTFDTFTNGMEDALFKFVQTGKLSFADLANSIIADLARIAVKKAIIGLASMFGFAAGGPVMAGTPIIVGERGPEMFVPQSAGKIVPNNQLGGSGGGSSGAMQTTVNYNIQAVDAASFRSLVARDPSFIYAVTERGRRSQPTRSR